MEKDYADITEALLRVIGKADSEFQEQLATGIGISLETFQDYIDNVEFPMVGKKDPLGTSLKGNGQ